MGNRKTTSFKPSWLDRGSPLSGSVDAPEIGVLHPAVPRLSTRLLPYENRHDMSAQTISEVLASTQRIVTFVAYDLVNGPHPNFSDLRSAGELVDSLSKLRVEPFEDGSFVIPAKLSDASVSVQFNGQDKEFTGFDVLNRFSEILATLGQPSGSDFSASIGLVQAVEELGKVIRREASQIEFYPATSVEKSPVVVNSKYIASLTEYRKDREATIARPDDITGRLTAVDVTRGILKLLVSRTDEIRGSFTPMMEEQIVRNLNRRVKLSGTLETKHGKVQFIRAVIVEDVD